MTDFDAVVVGAGPNGLAAAVVLARAGLSVAVFEREPTIGGGARTEELTLPGFLHDVCSAVHPMALASPFFREFGLADRVDLRVPELSYAHPLDAHRAGLAYRDLSRAADALGADGAAWRRLFAPLVHGVTALSELTGTSLVNGVRHPVTLATLGMRVLEQGGSLWNARFSGEAAPAMLAGVFAHANRRLPDLSAAAAGLVLGVHAHAAGWPIPVGGSQAIVDAMAVDVVEHGGVIRTGVDIATLDALPSSTVVLADVSARGLLRLAGDRMPDGYRRRLGRVRYGNAVAKVDFALDGPVPWTNPELTAAGTLHLGGSRAAIAAAEGEVAAGRMPETPYVLASQPSVIDDSRAPSGSAVVWAYTHVPSGSTADREKVITDTIERLAPGFRDRILATSSRTAVDVETHNPNYVGGDISAGDVSLRQLLARPTLLDPWRTPVAGLYLASGSAAPGPGVHGMSGYWAARRALAVDFGIADQPSLSS